MADENGDERPGGAQLRHFVRNRLAAVRNAAFYLQRRFEPTTVWQDDPRVARFFELIIHELTEIDTAISRDTGAPAAPSPSSMPPAVGARVLVIDDHDGNRETLAALLEDEDFAVAQAATFEAALIALESDAVFDVLLLDRHLGPHDGLQLVPLVRATRPSAKIIVVSGSCSEPVPGIDDVVGKDLGFDVLLPRLRRLLGPP